jgi:amino acid adenylation domain-containing protein/non-ribosomal peptide synthase protein (TIGR01720 family)
MNPATENTFVELLTKRADIHPDRIALRFLGDDIAPVCRSYADLDLRARAVAARLQASLACGERAIILLPSGAEYVDAFLGCLYAAVVAVPAFPPESARPQHLNRLFSIVRDSAPRVVLTQQSLVALVSAALAELAPDAVPEIIAVDGIDSSVASSWRMPALKTGALAFLQYTSGSTAAPKGVMVGHDNLMANERAIQRSFGIGEADSFVSWLPLYHDMGLVGGLLQPIFSGIALTLMSPRHFLERPVRWLQAVSRFQATISGGPDFAFRLCAERITETMAEELDLSTWRLAFCGAEPVRRDTLGTFAAKFAPSGLNSKALYPCYGLAEATLLVTGGKPGTGFIARSFDSAALAENRAIPAEEGTCLVACGEVQDGHRIAIVDAAGADLLKPGSVGEIWLSGPSVTHGYWNRPDATHETFVRREGAIWLRTGDLGFREEGGLYVAGRIKDLILVRGQNLYPQDIEQTVEEQVELVRKGRVAAFAIDIGDRESIGVAAEVSRTVRKLVSPESLCQAIHEAIAEAFQEAPGLVLLLEPGALPKTSSGKLQRSACRNGWRNGTLASYAAYQNGRLIGAEDVPPAPPAGDMERRIAAVWGEVLGLARIERDQNFFALGGNSIDAIRVLARLEDLLGHRLEPRLFFEAPTLRQFAAAVENRATACGGPGRSPIARTRGNDRLPLSPGQRGLWIMSALEPEGSAYHMAGGLRLRGELDAFAVRASLEALLERHEMLRTTFHEEGGQPYQRIEAAGSVPLRELDLSGETDAETAAERLGREDARRPFDLSQGPLWRAGLVRLGPEEHRLWLVLHHLIGDGWSLSRLLEEFGELYAAARAGRAARLAALPIRYADYAVWQRAWLEAGESRRQLEYWKERLGDEQPALSLPGGRPRPEVPSHRGGRIEFRLDPATVGRIGRLAQTESATPFMVLLAAFAALLYRYSGQSDQRIGVPLGNRQRAETEGVIGYFVTTVVFRIAVEGRLNYRELLGRVKDAALGAQAHPDLPFEQLVDALKPERRLGHNPLFQVMYNHQKRDLRALERITGLRLDRCDPDAGGAQFDLSLDTEEDGSGCIGGAFTYALDLFEASAIERLQAHFLALLNRWTEAPARCLGEMELLSEVEWEALRRWNAWEGSAAEVALAELIRRQAEARPAGVAVVCGGERLSYGELEARSNRLARRLGRLGVVAETRVGVVLERTADLVVALLGILKAGGAFVPLAAGLPAGRLSRLLADAGVRVVLLEAGEEGREAVPAGVARLVRGGDWGEGEPASAPAVEVHPEQLAYLIYTSGSTGQPKAVAVGHGALSRHIQAAGRWYGLGPDDRCLHFAAFSFDAALEQWAAPLAHGATLVLGQPGWSGEDTAAAVRREGISVIYPPTPHLLHLADAVAAQGERLRLRICTVGGEAVAWDSLARLRRVLRPARLINGYGPTETVITPLAWTAGPEDAAPATGAYVPIGRPLGQRSAWVLNRDLQPVPPGLEGELYIGGPCLARGYHGRPGLTAERFLPDPFGAPGSRLYRSGDRVRQGPDGTVAYLGRTDQQIKLRGHRIEPGEIEAALLAQPGVREAVVVLREDHGRRYLAGYVGGAADLSADGLRRALAAELPAPLVPSALIVLARLPRTAHGKVDRPALPAPAPAAGAIAPRTAAERQLAAIWQELLGRPGPGPELAPRLLRAEPRGEAEGQSRGIGVGDNFFELGGDSILAIQVVSRARQAGLHFTPQDLFRHPTLESLARHAQTVARPAIDPGPVTGDVPLTPIQAEFFALDLPDRRHWNQALLLRPRQPLHPGRLAAALDHLVRHHDSLRLRYRATAQGWEQRYAAPDPAPDQTLLWQAAVADAAAIEAQAQRAQRSLDLADGPLLRAVHLRVGDGSERLLLVIHHLVVDGVSWRILLEDLQAAYTQLGQHLVPRLPAKTSAYRDWARRLAGYAGSAALAGELDYWESQLQGADPHWPADPPAGADPAGSGGVSLRLDRAATRQLLHEAGAAYRSSLQDLLLTALARVLCRWSGRPDVLIALEGHGREDLFDDIDLSRTVGWFTSIYPVRLRPSAPLGASSGQAQDLPQDGLGDALLAVKDQLRQVPHHGLGYGLLKHLAPAAWRARLAALPVPAVAFNYLGQFDASFDPRHSLWLPAAESAGDDRAPAGAPAYAFELNSEIYDGELHLTWCYDPARYRQPTVQALAQTYLNELDALRAHCLSGVCRVSPTDFPLARLTQPQLDALHLPWNHIDDLFPLSPLQQGILFHALQLGDKDPYFYQRLFRLSGELDAEAFSAAWQAAVARHPALRSAYRWEEGDALVQAVLKFQPFALPELDWRGLSAAAQWQHLAKLLDEERRRGFDFSGAAHENGPGLRLIRVSDRQWWLLWSHHHIALDGWSMGLVLRDVMREYANRGSQAVPAVPAYADYQRWLEARDHAAALDYWRKLLAGFSEPTPLPLGSLNAADGGDTGYEEHSFSLGSEGTQRLRNASRFLGVTPGTFLQAAFALLLGRHCDRDEVVFGLTVSGRSGDLPGIEEMVGLFINTLPLRLDLRSSQNIAAWLRELQEAVAAIHQHEFTPLAEIQRVCEIGDGRGLFESILVFENYPLDPALTQEHANPRIELLDPYAPEGILNRGRGRNNYALTLVAHPGETLNLTFSGRLGQFQPGAMAVLARRFQYLLEQLAGAPDRRLGDLELERESAPLPSAFEGEAGKSDGPDLLTAWRENVARSPEAPAVRDASRVLSFKALDLAADELACALKARGAGPDTPVGVYLDRSVDLAVALLGILKAGAVYVPLARDLPQERLSRLLRDAGIETAVCTAEGREGLLPLGIACLVPDELPARGDEPGEAPVSPGQGAYIVYTSGSTGQPKGVLISRGALSHYVHGVLRRLEPLPAGSMAMVSTPAADLGHTVLFGALCAGRLLHLIPPGSVADADRFAAYMAEHRVATLKIVPGHLRGLLQAANPADVLPEKLLILGGEACPRELVETVRRLKPGCRIVNHYGPTESTVGVLTHEPGAELEPAFVPIGRPLAGVRVAVMDRDLHSVPVGVAGELYLGGPQLARGYWGKPGLTAERFVPDPAHPGERLYRTGDRVSHDGERIEFMGRVDAQIKIRGYRVEPDEIAAILRGLDGVRDALVVADTTGGPAPRLLGYFVADGGTRIQAEDLAEVLRQKLPEYMVPSVLIPLERIPLTANGKPDRKALPEPGSSAAGYAAPRNETERKLAEIWRTVLKLERVGITDNFFELGGDSILSLQVIARARKQGIKLTPKQLFDSPTIAGLSEAEGEPAARAEQTIPRLPLPERPPLSYGQERLWFLSQLEPESAAYHIAGGLKLEGKLDEKALQQTFDTLAQRHEMLRTTFHQENGQPYQRIHPPEPAVLRCIGPGLPDKEALSEEDARRPFDLERGPLWRVTLVRLGEESHELWLTLHHIIADGWSLNRLLEEFAALYAARREGRQSGLPPLPIRYADYAVWQRRRLEAGEGERQLACWTKRLGSEHPPLELPFDGSSSATTRRKGARQTFTLPAALGSRLKDFAQGEGATPFMVLLAAFAALLYRYTGQADIRLGVPVANRSRVETEGVVGFLVNTLVLRTEVEGRLGFRALLTRVRATVVEAQNNADLPFEQLVEALGPERSLHHTPLFQVLFNHQKRDLSALKSLPGLRLERIGRDSGAAQFDLSLATEEDDEGRFTGSFGYALDRFEPSTIERMGRHFLNLLGALLETPEFPLGTIPLLAQAERARLQVWNATARGYPADPVHRLIERQARRQPEATALVFEDRTLSYGALEARANRLAHRLIGLGVGPDVAVGVLMQRSLEMAVSLLAILKAGGAYVPLDPEYPEDRLRYMLEDSGIGILLSSRPKSLPGNLWPKAAPYSLLPPGEGTGARVCLDLDSLDLSMEPEHAPSAALHPDHLAYVIYTSGSTGRPKGVGNTHGALANRLHWMQEAYGLDAGDTVLQKTPFGFDVSVWEFFWPLMTGARLAIAAPGEHRDPARLAALIRAHGVTTLHFVPSMLQEFLAHDDAGGYPSLRRIVCSGEALSAELRNRVFQRLPGVDLHNLYGPTEAAIDVAHWTCRDDGSATVPIGQAIANLAIHILDADLNPVPTGVAGELYIGGAGLARGYHRRPALTAERFVPDPLGRGGRLYRTGDRARRRHDGVLEYLGRLDHQVKLRGFRIEPGEIEARLLAQPGVREAVALVAERPGGAVLIAYVAADGASVEAEALKASLRRTLPEYMVPAQVGVLERLPKTSNGKLDRKALPDLQWRKDSAEPPATATERRLAAIWQDLLGLPKVGRRDNFFELGGHSLLAARMVSLIRADLEVSIPLASLFETANLAQLAATVDAARPVTNGDLDVLDELMSGLEAACQQSE